MVAPPTIDGILEQGEWAGAIHTDSLIDQTTLTVATEPTDIWIGYDSKNIYVAAHIHMDHPDQIVARSNQPGSNMDGEDFFRLVIDPLNRKRGRESSQFTVNAKGTHSEVIAGGRASKLEWRGDWQSAAKVVSDGWTVEMAIPWAMLDLPAKKLADVQINFVRYTNAKHSFQEWSDRGLTDLPERDGTWKNIEIPKVDAKAKVQTLVYASPDFDVTADPKLSFHSGVDIRYQPNRQITGLLAINPDFKNIESAIAGIEFTRSERFVQDARPFFLEGGDYFRLGSGFSFGQLFYSNRIDSFSEGVKVFGNITPTDSVGALVVAGSNNRLDSVYKVKHLFGNSNEVSVYGTNRSDPSSSSSSLGSSGRLKFGNFSPGYHLASTTGLGQTRSAVAGYLDYSVPRFFSTLQYQSIQPGFNPALGFIEFDDKRGAYSYSEYNTELRSGPMRALHAEIFLQNYQHFNGKNQQKGGNISFGGVTRHDVFLGVGATTDRFEDQESFITNVSATWNASNSLDQLNVSLNQGQRGGDPTTYFQFNANKRFFGKIDLGISHSKQQYLGRSYQTIGTIGWELDKYRYISARFVQQQGDTNFFLSYRRAGGKGVEYYFIVGDPRALTYRNRVAFKVIWSN